MNLIRDIEIAYFRSFYKERLSDASHSNIIFGRNDSGKSNILRALNLFFNGETNPGKEFNFDIDFSSERMHEAESRSDARKFIYVKIWFNTPKNYVRSLGKEFYVKRQWNVSAGTDYGQEISSILTSTSARQSVTRLLNQVKFTYIPAVKDRSIFSSLLNDIYSILSEDSNFSESLSNFSGDIQRRTKELSKSLSTALGFRSEIAPPSDLALLFRSLDFETQSGGTDDTYSLILQRGDGVQVRHIPEMLRFVAEYDRRQFHIWGLEEPENSLELSSALGEAKALTSISKENNKQIFITSHSPAFFNADNSISNRYFVDKKDHGSKINKIDKFDEIDNMRLMGDDFILPLVSKKIDELEQEIIDYKNHSEKLENIIEETYSPLLFVEGDSDKNIFRTLWPSLINDGDLPFQVEAAGGVNRLKAFAVDGTSLAVAANQRPIFVVIDNDCEGRRICPCKANQCTGIWKRYKNGVYWWLLHPTEEAKTVYSRIGLSKQHPCFVLEDCFSAEVRQEAKRDGCYELGDIRSDLKDPNSGINIYELMNKIEGNPHIEFYVRDLNKDYKLKFSKWIIEKINDDPEIIHYFKPIISSIKEKL